MVNFRLFIAITSILFISCGKSTVSKSQSKYDTIKIFNRLVYEKSKDWKLKKNQLVIVVDTFCINQTLRAQKDIKRNKLTYFIGVGVASTQNQLNRLKLHFPKYRIEFNEHSPYTCLGRVDDEQFKIDCYEVIMNEEFTRIYGEKIVDSINNFYRRKI